MAMKTRGRQRRRKAPPFWATVTTVCLLLAAYWLGLLDPVFDYLESNSWNVGPSYNHVQGEGLYVHFLSVGKADSILVICDGETMLVDAGEAETVDYVVSYAKKQGIARLDYIVATHPHMDHIGGMPEVIKRFTPGMCYISPRTHTTNAFMLLINNLEAYGVETVMPKVGQKAAIGAATITFYAPNRDDYKEMNDSSLVFMLEYQGVRILFAADAESESESDMLDGELSLRADVLKVAHHGSNSSSKKAFIEAVNPDYAVITQADIADSSDKVLERLRNVGAEIFSTDNGEVLLSVEGGVLRIDYAK